MSFNFWSSTLDLDSDSDPDPDSLEMLDPDPDSINPDAQHCMYNPSPRCRTWTRKSWTRPWRCPLACRILVPTHTPAIIIFCSLIDNSPRCCCLKTKLKTWDEKFFIAWFLFSGNTCYMNATIQCLKVRSTLLFPVNIDTWATTTFVSVWLLSELPIFRFLIYFRLFLSCEVRLRSSRATSGILVRLKCCGSDTLIHIKTHEYVSDRQGTHYTKSTHLTSTHTAL